MKVKVSEASGPVLDWMVAIALGHKAYPHGHLNVGTFGPLFGKSHKAPAIGFTKARFSTNWSQGGPIIERERISWHCGNKSNWHAYGYGSYDNISGPTPLIAAMRCFCASRLGDEVEVPSELLT